MLQLRRIHQSWLIYPSECRGCSNPSKVRRHFVPISRRTVKGLAASCPWQPTAVKARKKKWEGEGGRRKRQKRSSLFEQQTLYYTFLPISLVGSQLLAPGRS